MVQGGLKAAGGNIFFAGDTVFSHHFAALRKDFGTFRLALLPIGAFKPEWFMGPIHMTPEEAVEAHRFVIQAAPTPPPEQVHSKTPVSSTRAKVPVMAKKAREFEHPPDLQTKANSSEFGLIENFTVPHPLRHFLCKVTAWLLW